MAPTGDLQCKWKVLYCSAEFYPKTKQCKNNNNNKNPKGFRGTREAPGINFFKVEQSGMKGLDVVGISVIISS